MRMLKDLAILLGVTVAILFISAYIQHAGKSIDEKVKSQTIQQNCKQQEEKNNHSTP